MSEEALREWIGCLLCEYLKERIGKRFSLVQENMIATHFGVLESIVSSTESSFDRLWHSVYLTDTIAFAPFVAFVFLTVEHVIRQLPAPREVEVRTRTDELHLRANHASDCLMSIASCRVDM